MSIDDAQKYLVFGLHKIAISYEPLPARLGGAYAQYIVNAGSHIPDHCRPAWESISSRMIANESIGNAGAIAVTSAMMDDDTAREIIGDILELLGEIAKNP